MSKEIWINGRQIKVSRRIKVQAGSILSVEKGVIIHQVNCQGKMNSGVAKALRDKYPQVFKAYREKFPSKPWGDNENIFNPADLLGKVQLVPIKKDLVVVNVFGQLSYGKKGKFTSYDALHSAFEYLYHMFGNDEPIHIPLIGCGTGGGEWSVVQAIILENLKTFGNINLWVPELMSNNYD